MMRSRFTLLALALSIAAPAFAQVPPATIAGDWDVTINSPQGSSTIKATFTQDGEKVGGLLKSPRGEMPFTGMLTGNDVKLTYTLPIQGQSIEITMTGKVDGDSIAGKADFGGFAEGDWTAKRSPAVTTTETTPSETTTTTDTTTSSTTTTTTTTGFGGKWDVMLKTPGGDFPASATLTDEAGKLTGTFGSPMGEVPVSGTVEGKAMKITLVAQTPQGSMTVVLTGDLDGDSIVNGKADVEGLGQMEWSAKRTKQ